MLPASDESPNAKQWVAFLNRRSDQTKELTGPQYRPEPQKRLRNSTSNDERSAWIPISYSSSKWNSSTPTNGKRLRNSDCKSLTKMRFGKVWKYPTTSM